MLLQQRLREILKLLHWQGQVVVTDLAAEFGVSEETIRRDLTKLELKGQLLRSHGGAVVPEVSSERPYHEREAINSDTKRKIAEAAIKFLKPNDCIMLDGSSTAYYLAKALPDCELSVVTSSVRIADELSDKSVAQLILLGGEVAASSLSCTGEATVRALNSYRVDKLFFSCAGVDTEVGLTDSNEAQAILRRASLNIASECVLLADSSKFGMKMLHRVCALNELGGIITDDGIDKSMLAQVRKLVPKITIARGN